MNSLSVPAHTVITVNEHTFRWGHQPRENTPQLSATDIPLYLAFLETPHAQGYWRFSARWKKNGVIQKFLIQAYVAPLAPGHAQGTLLTETPEETKRRELETALKTRISPIFQTFDFALRQLRAPSAEVAPPETTNEPPLAIAEKLKATFPEAFSIFETGIWFEGYNPVITQDPFFHRHGPLVFHSGPADHLSWMPEDKATVEVSSLNRESLRVFGEFLEKCGAIHPPSIERIFSPEETLMEPYFDYLKLAFPHVVETRIQQQIDQAFDYYKKGEITHCISTLGLVAEDYLEQVYTSFFREPCPSGLTLGQIDDRIHQRLREIMEAPKQEALPLKAIYEQLKTLQEKKKEVVADELATLVRSLIDIIKQDRLVFHEQLQQVRGKPKSLSVFPRSLRDKLEELIRNRNAASHKTRIPLGQYEAQKTLLGLVSLLLWWKNLKKCLAWEESREAVLKTAIDLTVEGKKAP